MDSRIENIKQILDKAINAKIRTGWRFKGGDLKEKYEIEENDDFSGPFDLVNKNHDLDENCDKELIYLSFYLKGLKKAKKIVEKVILGLGPDDNQYISHCWKCKSEIDSRANDRCEKCKWYICSICGSCEDSCSQATLQEVIKGIDFED